MNPEQTLGERIRKAREARGLSLEAVGRETRLALSVLRALEEDKRAELPGDLYVANALRMVADTLELDRAELMALYRGGQPAAGTPPAAAAGKVWREEVPETRVVGGWRPGRGLWLALGGLVLAAGILLAALWAFRTQESRPQVRTEEAAPPTVDASLGPVEAPPPEEDSLAQAAQAAQPVDSVALAAWASGPLALAVAAPGGTDAAPPAAAADQGAVALRLELDAVAPIELQLNIDDRRRLVRALAAGESWRVEAEHFVVLNVANAEGLALRLNGQDYPLPVLPAGAPLALRLDAPIATSSASDG
jgi:cytoskeleton protein RodZ